MFILQLSGREVLARKQNGSNLFTFVRLAEERVISAIEEVLLPDFAKATNASVSALHARLHSGRPAFGRVAPPRAEAPLPEVPKRDGWTAGGAFRVFGSGLVCGESFQSEADSQRTSDGAGPNIIFAAKDGVWFAYEDDDFHGLAIHESVIDRDNLDSAALAGAVWVEGGTVPLLDVEVRDDAAYQREVDCDPTVLGRGFVFNMGGDGDTEIHVLRIDDRAVAVWINALPQ